MQRKRSWPAELGQLATAFSDGNFFEDPTRSLARCALRSPVDGVGQRPARRVRLAPRRPFLDYGRADHGAGGFARPGTSGHTHAGSQPGSNGGVVDGRPGG